MDSRETNYQRRTQLRRLGRLLRYAKPYRWGWVAIVAVTLLASASSVLQPWPMKILIDNVLMRHPFDARLRSLVEWLPGTGSAFGVVTWVALATLLLFALNSVFEVVLTFLWVRVGQGMVYT